MNVRTIRRSFSLFMSLPMALIVSQGCGGERPGDEQTEQTGQTEEALTGGKWCLWAESLGTLHYRDNLPYRTERECDDVPRPHCWDVKIPTTTCEEIVKERISYYSKSNYNGMRNGQPFNWASMVRAGTITMDDVAMKCDYDVLDAPINVHGDTQNPTHCGQSGQGCVTSVVNGVSNGCAPAPIMEFVPVAGSLRITNNTNLPLRVAGWRNEPTRGGLPADVPAVTQAPGQSRDIQTPSDSYKYLYVGCTEGEPRVMISANAQYLRATCW